MNVEIYQQVLETSLDSSWSLALPSFQLEYANKESTEKLLGYPIEAFYEDSNFWHTIIYPPDQDLAIEANNECMRTGHFETKYRMVRKDGKVIWVLVRLRLIKDADGNPVRLIGSSMDINDAFIKEQQLRESEVLFHSLATYAPIGIYITDLQGHFIYTNEAWQKIAGVSLQDALGDGWKNCLHPDDLEKTSAEWKQATQEKRNFQGEFRFLNKKNGIRFVNSRAVPINDAKGNSIGFVGTVEDITDKLAQRERLVASSKMSSLGEMASGIAHEINNPLMIIVGLCTRLKRLCGSEKEHLLILRNEVEKIESTTFRISKIINGLRNFSRNSDKDPMDCLSMIRLIEDTLELCSQRFKDHQIELMIDFGKCGHVEVEARPSQLTQVLLNLLSNAFDAVENLPEKWVKIKLNNSGDDVFICVEDSGKGIPKEIVHKMMDPFFTTKEVGKGTGLGLSISKGIMEEHHGKLLYDESSPHTCFKIQLKKLN